MTTNQVLVSSPIENKHIIRAVSRRSDRIQNLQTEQNDNMQAEEDRMVIDQQVNESWATDIGAHHFDSMSEAYPIFTEVNSFYVIKIFGGTRYLRVNLRANSRIKKNKNKIIWSFNRIRKAR
jgi:hypothetical protein